MCVIYSIAKLRDVGVSVQNSADSENMIKKRIMDFRRVLEQNDVLTEFDRYVFESIVDKVIMGGIDDDENKDPSLLTFIYKTGFTNSVDSEKNKLERKIAKVCSDEMWIRRQKVDFDYKMLPSPSKKRAKIDAGKCKYRPNFSAVFINGVRQFYCSQGQKRICRLRYRWKI